MTSQAPHPHTFNRTAAARQEYDLANSNYTLVCKSWPAYTLDGRVRRRAAMDRREAAFNLYLGVLRGE